MSRKKLGGSFWIVRNLGFERIVKLRGALLGGWKLGIYAHEKLGVCNRGICETSGCVFVVWAWCVRWLLFLYVLRFLSFRLSCIRGTFFGVKELKQGCYLRYVYIFRFSVGVFAV